MYQRMLLSLLISCFYSICMIEAMNSTNAACILVNGGTMLKISQSQCLSLETDENQNKMIKVKNQSCHFNSEWKDYHLFCVTKQEINGDINEFLLDGDICTLEDSHFKKVNFRHFVTLNQNVFGQRSQEEIEGLPFVMKLLREKTMEGTQSQCHCSNCKIQQIWIISLSVVLSVLIVSCAAVKCYQVTFDSWFFYLFFVFFFARVFFFGFLERVFFYLMSYYAYRSASAANITKRLQ